jgi:hypothetical protein
MKDHICLKTGKPFARGLRPTSRARIAGATPFRKPKTTIPPSCLIAPATMSMWLNDVDGDCVTARSAFNMACAGVLIADATVLAWCNANGTLNGADLLSVLTQMQASGFAQDSNIYGNGAPLAVNYEDAPTVQAAIYQAAQQGGCLSVGVAADELPAGAGNQNGWLMLTDSPDANEDHCMGASGYGTLAQCVAMMNAAYPTLSLTVPTGGDPTTPCVCMYTWSTIGIVSWQAWLNFVAECWIANPSSTITGTGTPTPDVVYSTVTPTPGPGPGPSPTPTPTPGMTTVLLTDPNGSDVTSLTTYPTNTLPPGAAILQPATVAGLLADIGETAKATLGHKGGK